MNKKKVIIFSLMIITMFFNIGDCQAAKKITSPPDKKCKPEYAMNIADFKPYAMELNGRQVGFDEFMTNADGKDSHAVNNAATDNYCLYSESQGYVYYKMPYIHAKNDYKDLTKIIFKGETINDVYNSIEKAASWDYIYGSYCNNSPSTNDLCKKLSDVASGNTSGTSNNSNSEKTCSYNFRNTSIGVSFKIDIFKTKKGVFNLLDLAVTPSSNTETLIDNGDAIQGGNFWLYFYENNKDFNSFKLDYLKSYNDSKTCPTLYLLQSGKTKKKWYVTLNQSLCEPLDPQYGACQTTSGGKTDKVTTWYDAPEFDSIIGEENTVKVCSDIITEGGDLQKLLRGAINVVKILIPIALLALGILDFTQAIFSSSEDAMKKAQGKFIKRVIIAVVIFLIPTVIKVVLSLAHNIWPVISSDLCGII